MTKYNYSISISAKTEADAIDKMKALTVLAAKLSAKELKKLADVVANDPVKTGMAKMALGL